MKIDSLLDHKVLFVYNSEKAKWIFIHEEGPLPTLLAKGDHALLKTLDRLCMASINCTVSSLTQLLFNALLNSVSSLSQFVTCWQQLSRGATHRYILHNSPFYNALISSNHQWPWTSQMMSCSKSFIHYTVYLMLKIIDSAPTNGTLLKSSCLVHEFVARVDEHERLCGS